MSDQIKIVGGVFDGELMAKMALEGHSALPVVRMKVIEKVSEHVFTGHDVILRPKIERDADGNEIWEDIGS